MNLPIPILSVLFAASPLLHASPSPAPDPLRALAAAAIAGDSDAIAKLRAAGPPALEAVFDAGRAGISALRQNESRLEAPENAKLRAAVDGVARQRDAFSSGLYWFTDLEAAKAEARRTRRPILSLRLLGNLDDEFSCANSRFFRTSLYANRSVSSLLRRGFVLHWKSVRPVPILTIDMGDGRRIKRTITGNSIHYILDTDGNVLDALPGNYGPAAFIAALGRTDRNVFGRSLDERRRWHGKEADALCNEWLEDSVHAGAYGEKSAAAMQCFETGRKLLTELRPKAFPEGSFSKTTITREEIDKLIAGGTSRGVSAPTSRFGRELVTQMMFDDLAAKRAESASGGLEPVVLTDAAVVGRMFPRVAEDAVKRGRPIPAPMEFDPPKGMVERPILKQAATPSAEAAMDPASITAASTAPLAQRMTTQLWAKIAGRYPGAVRLDESSCRLMMAKLPETMLLPEEIKTGWISAESTSPMKRMLDNFESAIIRDMVRNEYYFHTLIHQWLEEDKDGTLSRDVEAFNKRVYAELFLTPDYDEWLGLVPEDTYTALERDGCACDKGAPPMHTTRAAR